MSKEVVFLKHGLFEKNFMKSRINTPEMTLKEKILGYLLGPFGILAFMAMVNQLAELYYTEIFYIDNIFGVGTYLVLSYATRIVAVIAGLAAAYIAEHNASSAGRIRPLVLFGAVISAFSGFCLFWIPNMPDTAKLVWVYVFMFLYNGIGTTLFGLKSNMLTLGTRNQKDRNQITLFDQMSAYLLVGTFVTLVVGSVLYYTMLHNHPASNWVMLMGPTAAVSIPLSFVQYFFTKERITFENSSGEENALEEKAIDFTENNKKSVWKQCSDLMHCRYFVLATLLTLIISIVNSLNGYNLATNFCTVILGATAENNYNLFYTIVSGLPMGLGILVIYPLSNKFTIRKTTIAFSILCIISGVVGYIAKGNLIGAIAANFLVSCGSLPTIYILNSLINASKDEVEYKYDYRPEGTLALGIITCTVTLFSGIFSGVYETGLSAFGYAPENGMAQSAGVINWIMFVRYAVPMIEYALIIFVLFFLTLEKQLPKMHEEIEARRHAHKE